jgi:arginine decarboxylase-like protein
MEIIFNIADYLPSTITTRKAMEEIRQNLNLTDNRIVAFNFSNIDFISRAFADELLHFIEKNKIRAHFTNANTVVKQILDAVNKNRNQRNNGFHNIAVTHFQEREQLNQFLSLI